MAGRQFRLRRNAGVGARLEHNQRIGHRPASMRIA
jgi:hypothetical protein